MTCLPDKVAVIVTTVLAVTFLWVTVNLTVVAPESTFTDVGTVTADVLELVKETVVPVVGAIPVNVSVPVTSVVALPFTVVGATVRESNAAGSIVTEALCVLVPTFPVSVTVVAVDTARVLAVKFTDDAPTGTDTVAGRVIDLGVAERDTTTGAVPGTALRVATPARLAPPVTEAGVTVSPVIWNGITVRLVVAADPP